MALPEDYAKFDMGWWTADSRSPGATTCGTVACAGGHGPIAGIPSLPGEYWGDYIPRVFGNRSEEHTSELQSLMRISYAFLRLKKKRTAPSRSSSNTKRHL